MHSKAKRLLTLLLGPVLSLAVSASWADLVDRSTVNMSPGATALGLDIYNLHMLVIWISVGIGVAVFAVMFYSLIAHRKSQGHQADHWHEHLGAELAWTLIPFVILGFMAWPAIQTLLKVYDTDEPAIDIVITGYQWKWKYDYLGEEGVSFFSNLATPQEEIQGKKEKSEFYLLEVDEPIHIPVNTKVRFLITGNDVIHSWWVPELAVKKDAIPGIMNEAWTRVEKVGIYRGQCAELCGKDHGFMPIVVVVEEQADYDKWLNGKKTEAKKLRELMAQTFTLEQQIERDKKIYDASCAACHGAKGEGGVGKPIAGSQIATGPVDGHLKVAVNGVPGTAMQAFGGILNDVDMAAVVTYQRNAFGNNMGDTLQPVDVYKFKNAK
ncbi:MAG: cytochrome c oxidase subunit II [Cellvibrionales bacterium]|nr:cytochrome c oxidase subunit II [Cellvibrionales bacterium]